MLGGDPRRINATTSPAQMRAAGPADHLRLPQPAEPDPSLSGRRANVAPESLPPSAQPPTPRQPWPPCRTPGWMWPASPWPTARSMRPWPDCAESVRRRPMSGYWSTCRARRSAPPLSPKAVWCSSTGTRSCSARAAHASQLKRRAHRRLGGRTGGHARRGGQVALGDGGVSLVAEKRDGQSMKARVLAGGKVQGRPGVTAPASQAGAEDAHAGRPRAPRGPAGRGHRGRGRFVRAHRLRPHRGAGR